jgi:hypothetical protein
MSIDERPDTRSKIWDAPVLRNFAPPFEVQPAADNAIEIVPWQQPGSTLRKKAGRARRGFYAPALAGAPTTTRQAEILNTAIIGAPTGTHGIVTGRDVLSRTAIAHDPVTGYNGTPRTVSSPVEQTSSSAFDARCSPSRVVSEMVMNPTHSAP